ncbi:MAG: TonB-dependent receptor [Candidatus Marinimicrobia bacterium]|nr:TonB-dependent receptor [Candidatus Neomarinimicrobiota bacterium]MCF7880604.1 TonB-dependent receptor [Candidatus Neomarinimicrobiota bacterium]
MKRFKKITQVFGISVLTIFITAYSLQAQSGTVRGLVQDSESGEPLAGANVVILGNNPMGAATDLHGQYQINGVPAGTHTLTVAYIGYKRIEREITVEAGERTIVNFEMVHETVRGEEVVVTAQSKGQLQAINQQLSSDKISNVVSEAKIRELPDFNAAQAIGRLPGVSTQKSSGEANKVVIRGLSPKYNSIEIEGIKLSATGSSQIGVSSLENTSGNLNNDRSVDLTMVTPYMIRTISLFKSLTPDMNANSIGGTVNMELREAPSERHFNMLWQSGYTAKSNTYGNYRAVLSGSDRFYNELLGVYALVNAESYDRDADNMTASYSTRSTEISPNGFPPVRVSSVTMNRHIERRNRYGANLILDYMLPSGNLKAVNMFARLNSDYNDYNQGLDYSGGDINWSFRHGKNTIDQQVNSLKLDYDLGFMSTDIAVAYTSSTNKLNDSPYYSFNQTGGIQSNNVEDNVVPDSLPHLVNYFGDSTAVVRSVSLFNSTYQEQKSTFKGDFIVPFNLFSRINGYIKFGGQYDYQVNTNDQSTPYAGLSGANNPGSIQYRMMDSLASNFDLESNSNGLFPAAEFTARDDDLYSPFLNDRFGQFYYAPRAGMLNNMIDYLHGNPEFESAGSATDPGGWFDGPYQRLANDYEYTENYYAGYLMSRINILKFMIIGGARYEKVTSEYFAYNARDRRNPQTQVMYPVTAKPENEFWLPMGQVRYSPFGWMDIRYAYTQTLARPDYHQLSPKYTITQSNQVYAGNPNLKPAEAFNHDVNVSFHGSKLGLLSIGAFHKTIEDFTYSSSFELNEYTKEAGLDSIERFQNPGPNPDARITLHKYINSPYKATVQGLELDLQTSLWYLPFPFDGMVFGVNYSYIESETRYPLYDLIADYTTRPPTFTFIDSSRTGRLVDQPENVVNSYIGYDYKGFSTRLSIIYQGNSVSYVGRYPQQDGYTKDYFRVDLSARQQLPWQGTEIFLDITNLNDERNISAQRSIDGFTNVQNYGMTANLGIRLRY